MIAYNGSTSEAAAALVFRKIGQEMGYETQEACFADRHSHRKLWAEIIWEYNKPYGITLYEDMLKASDILNGIRRTGELSALRDRKMIDWVVWIDRDVPEDPSLEMGSEVADFIIPNNNTLERFYKRLDDLAAELRIPKR